MVKPNKEGNDDQQAASSKQQAASSKQQVASSGQGLNGFEPFRNRADAASRVLGAVLVAIFMFTSISGANAYQLRGQPDPDEDGFVWKLPPGSQVLSRCGEKDLDWDGIQDWVESELAWAFRPYLVFDEQEKNSIADGTIILYQAFPEETVWEWNGWPPQEYIEKWAPMYIRFIVVLIFPKDKTHPGDTQEFDFMVRSVDPPHHTKWELVEVDWGRCGHPNLSIGCGPSNRPCWDFDHDAHAKWEIADGLYSDPVRWKPVGSTGMRHFKVYVSYGKHGLYPTARACECCWHGGVCEDCSSGWEGLSKYGVKGYQFGKTSNCGSQGGDCGFDHELTIQEYENLTEHQRNYLGNIGELVWGDFAEDGLRRDPRHLFMPTEINSSYWVEDGSMGSLDSAIAGPAFYQGVINYGIWGEWDYGFPGEYVWDTINQCFCGGESHEDEVCDDSTYDCAKRLKEKFTANNFFPVQPMGYPCSFSGLDKDQDGLLDELDCDPYNPYLKLDTDRDGYCDEPVPEEDRVACVTMCGILDGIVQDHDWDLCVHNCMSPQPDNCIDLDYEPCAIIAAGPSAYNGHISEWMVISNWMTNLQKCEDAFHNPNQEDGDGDSIGDKCQPHLKALNMEATVTDYVSGWGKSMGGGVMSWCTMPVHNVAIDFEAHGGDLPPGVRRPATLGACKCPDESGSSIDVTCRYKCPRGENYQSQNGLSSFTWAPINGCQNLGEEELAQKFPEDQKDVPGMFCPQGTRCRYKDVEFQYPEVNRYSIDFQWMEHKKFEVPDLETSLCHEPAETEDLNNRAVRLRLDYPDPQDGTLPSDSSWYPASDPDSHEYTVADLIKDDNIPQNGVDHYCFPVVYKWDRPPIWVDPGQYYRDDRLMKTRPGGRVFLADPLTGDQAVMTLMTANLVPSTFSKVTTFAGESLPLAGSVITSGDVNTNYWNMSSDRENVMFLYNPGTGSGGPDTGGGTGEEPVLYAGLVDREENLWLTWQDIFGPEATVPQVLNPKPAYHANERNLLLFGDTYDSTDFTHQGELRKNVVVKLDMDTGRYHYQGELWRLGGLEDYSVTVDQIWGKAIFAGGRRDGEAVGEVWVYDMESGVYNKTFLEEEECFSGRIFPGVAVDNRGRHVYIYGGMDDSGAILSDAWKVNLYTGRCTNLDMGENGGPGPLQNPFVLFDARKERLWVAEQASAAADPEVRMWALGLKTKTWSEELVAHGEVLPEGHYRAQLRHGRPVTIVHRVAEDMPYGQVLTAELISEGADLELEVKDRKGVSLNTSNPSSNGLIWPAVPGEDYLLVVSPGKNHPVAASVEFELIAEETTLEPAGQYGTNWKVRDLAVKGNTAFLACNKGLEAVDFSDEWSPFRLSREKLGKKGRSVEVMGSRVLFGRGPGLWGLKVIDAHDPAQMEEIGFVFTLGMVRDIGLIGRTAYTAQGLFGLNVWDLSDPANPVYTDTLSPGKVVYGLAAHRERVYVAHAGIIGTKKRVGIYNASNGFLGLLGEVETSKIPVAVRVQGNTLFAAGLNLINALKCFAGIKCLPADVVEVFDITDPHTPSKLTEIAFSEAEVLFGSSRGMKMVIQGENGFEIFRPEVQQ